MRGIPEEVVRERVLTAVPVACLARVMQASTFWRSAGSHGPLWRDLSEVCKLFPNDASAGDVVLWLTSMARRGDAESLSLQGRGSGLTSILEKADEPAGIVQNILQAVLPLCPRLATLRLALAVTIDSHIAFSVSTCPSLSDISVQQSSVTDAALEAIASTCPNLTSLNVARCTGITDNGLTLVAKQCSQLKVLNMEHCRTSDTVLDALCGKSNSTLTSLSVRGCASVTSEGLSNLAGECFCMFDSI